MKIKSLFFVFIHIALVSLTLFLAYRQMGPHYERNESKNVDTLGSLHTRLAAEKFNNKVTQFRSELHENALRLVDNSRGPINLDPSHWLWMRVQDRDWRAPNYLDPLPNPRSDVDTWRLSNGKVSMILSQRVPFVKDGVQDFVLVEGGLRNVAFEDIKNDDRFGIWLFDMKAYKEGGLSNAKLFESLSSEGALGKEDLQSLTSDLLSQLFKSDSIVSLGSKGTPWSLFFKTTSAESTYGVLGYWSPVVAPQNVGSVWLLLAGALSVLAVLVSLLLLKFFVFDSSNTLQESKAILRDESRQQRQEKAVEMMEPQVIIREVAVPAATLANDAIDLNRFARGLAEKLKNPFSSIFGHLELASDTLTQSLKGDDSVSLSLPEMQSRVLEFVDTARQEAKRCNRVIDRLTAFTSNDELSTESFDFEIYWKDFMASSGKQKNELPAYESYFDINLWRLNTDPTALRLLVTSYIHYLHSIAIDETSVVKMSLKHIPQDDMPVASTEMVELVSWVQSPGTLLRLILQVPTKDAFSHEDMQKAFEFFSGTSQQNSDVELPLSLRLIQKMGGRLRMTSNVSDGHQLILDLPAFEARKPEDLVYIQQTKNISKPVSDAESSERFEEIKETGDSQPQKAMRLSEIEKAKSFADQLSDERSRVRSRFRIRRPGEKE